MQRDGMGYRCDSGEHVARRDRIARKTALVAPAPCLTARSSFTHGPPETAPTRPVIRPNRDGSAWHPGGRSASCSRYAALHQPNRSL